MPVHPNHLLAVFRSIILLTMGWFTLYVEFAFFELPIAMLVATGAFFVATVVVFYVELVTDFF